MPVMMGIKNGFGVPTKSNFIGKVQRGGIWLLGHFVSCYQGIFHELLNIVYATHSPGHTERTKNLKLETLERFFRAQITQTTLQQI